MCTLTTSDRSMEYRLQEYVDTIDYLRIQKFGVEYVSDDRDPASANKGYNLIREVVSLVYGVKLEKNFWVIPSLQYIDVKLFKVLDWFISTYKKSDCDWEHILSLFKSIRKEEVSRLFLEVLEK